MKKYILLLISLVLFATCFANTDDHRHYRLPSSAYAFLSRNFPYNRILYIDRDDGKYHVGLTGDIQIGFDRNGRWYKMKSKRRSIPYSALPAYVRHRVCDRYHYPVPVQQIRRHHDYYEVKLANQRKMKIRRNGFGPSHCHPHRPPYPCRR